MVDDAVFEVGIDVISAVLLMGCWVVEISTVVCTLTVEVGIVDCNDEKRSVVEKSVVFSEFLCSVVVRGGVDVETGCVDSVRCVDILCEVCLFVGVVGRAVPVFLADVFPPVVVIGRVVVIGFLAAVVDTEAIAELVDEFSNLGVELG